MLPVSMADLPVFLAETLPGFIQGNVFHLPKNPDGSADTAVYVQIFLRWLHFLAGIIWIGHLYFFNLVNVNLMKALDGPTRGKVIPQLMPRALWWFRWGAVITVLVGLIYYAMYMVAPDARRAGKNPWAILGVWLVIVIIAFVITFVLIKKVDNGWALAVIIALVMIAMSVGIICWIDYQLGGAASTGTYSIGLGGGLGLIMLLNVWGIIWPNQKRIISGIADNAEKGTAIPAESPKLGRIAFLASRTNTWLSIPMLFLMGASAHFGGWMGGAS